MKLVVLSTMLAFTCAAAEMTKDKWDAASAGKTVFVKFQAPW